MLVGMCLTQADGWPAHLARMHQALTALPGHDQVRLGVIADWKYGPHLLTCWQTERTFGRSPRPSARTLPDHHGRDPPAAGSDLRAFSGSDHRVGVTRRGAAQPVITGDIPKSPSRCRSSSMTATRPG
jgi:hypothetical protein